MITNIAFMIISVLTDTLWGIWNEILVIFCFTSFFQQLMPVNCYSPCTNRCKFSWKKFSVEMYYKLHVVYNRECNKHIFEHSKLILLQVLSSPCMNLGKQSWINSKLVCLKSRCMYNSKFEEKFEYLTDLLLVFLLFRQ